MGDLAILAPASTVNEAQSIIKKNTRKLHLVICRAALLLQQSKVHERTYIQMICSPRWRSKADERCAPAVKERWTCMCGLHRAYQYSFLYAHVYPVKSTRWLLSSIASGKGVRGTKWPVWSSRTVKKAARRDESARISPARSVHPWSDGIQAWSAICSRTWWNVEESFRRGLKLEALASAQGHQSFPSSSFMQMQDTLAFKWRQCSPGETDRGWGRGRHAPWENRTPVFALLVNLIESIIDKCIAPSLSCP